jgi:hypothetical protein
VWRGRIVHDRLDQRRLFFWCYARLPMAATRLTVDAALAPLR